MKSIKYILTYFFLLGLLFQSFGQNNSSYENSTNVNKIDILLKKSKSDKNTIASSEANRNLNSINSSRINQVEFEELQAKKLKIANQIKKQRESDLLDAGYKDQDIEKIKEDTNFWSVFKRLIMAEKNTLQINFVENTLATRMNINKVKNKESFFNEFLDAIIFWE